MKKALAFFGILLGMMVVGSDSYAGVKVFYGAQGKFVDKEFNYGDTVNCWHFGKPGGSFADKGDPIPTVGKSCYVGSVSDANKLTNEMNSIVIPAPPNCALTNVDIRLDKGPGKGWKTITKSFCSGRKIACSKNTFGESAKEVSHCTYNNTKYDKNSEFGLGNAEGECYCTVNGNKALRSNLPTQNSTSN